MDGVFVRRKQATGLATAGVFVRFGSRYAFMIGPNDEKTHLALVRFGGHIEDDEGPVDCALRETREEAGIEVDLLSSSITYFQAGKYGRPVPTDSGVYPMSKPLLVR